VVSIILPAYNAQSYISEAITSVRDQTCEKWELIIVDDGSTDSTPAIAADFCRQDGRIRLITRENGKLAKARNTGIAVAAASGDFIAFLDADDIWQSGKLEQQIRVYKQTGADVIFSDAFDIYEIPDRLRLHPFAGLSGSFPGDKMFAVLYPGNVLPVSSVLLRYSDTTSACRFDENPDILGLEDYEMWLQLASRGATFFGMKERLVGYRHHHEQMSRRIVSMQKSAITVRQKYRSIAQTAGMDVLSQDLIDYQNLAYCSCNEGNRKLTWSSVATLCDFGRFGFAGLNAAAGATLHAFYHLIKKPNGNFR
jgi:glycosyltransferase involved in cell wall biosynthesis